MMMYTDSGYLLWRLKPCRLSAPLLDVRVGFINYPCSKSDTLMRDLKNGYCGYTVNNIVRKQRYES